MFVDFYNSALETLRCGVSLDDVRAMPVIHDILRAKFTVKEEELGDIEKLKSRFSKDFQSLVDGKVKSVA